MKYIGKIASGLERTQVKKVFQTNQMGRVFFFLWPELPLNCTKVQFIWTAYRFLSVKVTLVLLFWETKTFILDNFGIDRSSLYPIVYCFSHISMGLETVSDGYITLH